ncbi:Branched-chain amino acid transport system / permease component [Bacillus sp. THAF10]|uniref:ABC transporter permease n=1 Tax=Bacillus sp. THAF10 TaxID=2587848 RepID=UPI001268981E|nr:ABC transporter permease [Bacillus sp. THAF10]QFT89209.1 Branched-chain amino acid transport system / permease component [Bacillus sp. THAF10]
MVTAIFGSVELGIIYGIMALGVYLTFRVLDFPDLTVDGSFVTGAAVAATMIVNGQSPLMATMVAMVAGFLAGCLTGVLHTFGRINALLSGILMMIALYSINLRIMGRSNVPLLNSETFFTGVRDWWNATGIDPFINNLFISIGLENFLPRTWGFIFVMLIVTFAIKFVTDWFLKTEVGLAMRATGDNKRMIRSLSANTNGLVILGLGLSNAMVAFSGALIAQHGGYADVGMGIGMIIIGLASVIIGEAIFGTKTIARTTLAVIGGAIIYRVVITLALRVEFLETGDLKIITATIVVLALITPKLIEGWKEKRRKRQKMLKLQSLATSTGGGNQGAASNTD